MKSVKCPQCGLSNWETSEWCKRCKQILKSANITPPNSYAGSTSDFSDSGKANTQQNNYSQQNTYSQTNQTYRNSNADTKYTTSSKPVFDAENSFLAKNIERCNRNLMVVCIVVIVAGIGGFLWNARYLANVVLGPAAIEQERLLFSKSDLPDTFRNYVKVNADEVYDTGATYVEVSKYNVETVKSKYILLEIKDKLLLAEIDPTGGIVDGAKNVSLTGAITTIASDESEKVLEPLFRKQPELRSDVLPFVLKAKNDFSTPALIGSGIGLLLLTISGFCLWSALKKAGNPEDSAVMKSLAVYGSPQKVAASIDSEFGGQHEKIGPIYILPTWIVKNNTFSVSVQHVEDIVWMYKKVTKHSVNFIPTGKTYEVILHNSQGNVINLTGNSLNDEKTTKMLEKIYQRVPWVVTGYDNELISYWNSNKTAFVQTVKSRQKSYTDSVNQSQQIV